MNWYNENDPKAAAWLRELIKEGHIPAGDVDERSIKDVRGTELRNYTQCHFFAGIGGWALAFRLAGIPDNEVADSGSCPCQPFSAAGDQVGFNDPRHLWPTFRRVESQRRSPVIYGEQVASKLGREWLSRVRSDLERLGYAVGASDLCSACVGSPNIRQRLFWVADADGRNSSDGRLQRGGQYGQQQEDSGAGWVEHAASHRRKQWRSESGGRCSEPRCSISRLGNADHPRSQGWRLRSYRDAEQGTPWETGTALIACTDGKARRIKPGIFPLANGVSGRVGLLRGAGNAINPYVAAAFIKNYRDCRSGILSADPDF